MKILIAFIGILLVIFPSIDLQISDLFYVKGQGFIYKDLPMARMVFLLVPILTKLLMLILFVLLAIQVILSKFAAVFCVSKSFRPSLIALLEKLRSKNIKQYILFLLTAAFIGQVVVVDFALKNHFGRARPSEIQQFGGDKIFTPAFHISDQCSRNCSFVSGHAASGFYLTAFAYVVPLQYKALVYLLAIVSGAFIGLIRIIQGGHFFSDVYFAGLIIVMINYALSKFVARS